ncbi:MAG: phasin family protein [Pseudomonadota bacterium]
MVKVPEFQIPDQVRQMAEQNVAQTRSAYNQFLDMAREAQELATKSQGAMMQSALDVQTKALGFAEKNTEANFELAAELARARDLQQYIDIQTRHAQTQMQTFSAQAQELGQLMTEVAQKATKT